VFPEQQLRALRSVLPLSLGAKLIAEVEAEYVKVRVSVVIWQCCITHQTYYSLFTGAGVAFCPA